MGRSGQSSASSLDCVQSGPALLGVGRADRNVQGSVRVAKGGGQNVSGPEVGVRDETKTLSPSGVVAGLSGRMDKGSDRIVARSSLARAQRVA